MQEKDDTVRQEFHDADDTLREELLEHDRTQREEIESEIGQTADALRQELTEGYQDADAALDSDITGRFQEADEKLKEEFKADDKALESKLESELKEQGAGFEEKLKQETDRAKQAESNNAAGIDKLNKTHIIAGDGLAGGGPLSANVTVSHANLATDGSNTAGGTDKLLTTAVTDKFGHVTSVSVINASSVVPDRANTADKWVTPRSVTFTEGKEGQPDTEGDVTGVFNLDGSANVEAKLKVLDDSHKHSGNTLSDIDANTITKGTISKDRLPNVALSSFKKFETEEEALKAIKDGTVSEGDVLKVGDKNDDMYFVKSETGDKFEDCCEVFHAGIADAAPWSGITEKPDTATRWPKFSEVTEKPTTLEGYNITDGVNSVEPTAANGSQFVTHGTIAGHKLTLGLRQPNIADVNGLQTALDKEAADRNTAVNAVSEALKQHEANKSNPHDVTKEQLQLGNVDNTSDMNKPVSDAVQTALDKKADKAFSNVTANANTISATTKNDTLTVKSADDIAVSADNTSKTLTVSRPVKTLAQNTDLNTVKERGEYVCLNNADANTLKNCPTTWSFAMEVIESGARHSIVQRITEYAPYNPNTTVYTYNSGYSDRIWVRSLYVEEQKESNGSADHWSEWEELAYKWPVVDVALSADTYDKNTFYPVSLSAFPVDGMYHVIQCVLPFNINKGAEWTSRTNDKAVYACISLLAKARSWGAQNAATLILDWSALFIKEGFRPIGYQQLSHSSVPILWLRGGADYKVKTSWPVTPVIHTSEWQARPEETGENKETVAPKTGANTQHAPLQADLGILHAQMSGTLTIGGVKYNGWTNNVVTSDDIAKVLYAGHNSITHNNLAWSPAPGNTAWEWEVDAAGIGVKIETAGSNIRQHFIVDGKVWVNEGKNPALFQIDNGNAVEDNYVSAVTTNANDGIIKVTHAPLDHIAGISVPQDPNKPAEKGLRLYTHYNTNNSTGYPVSYGLALRAGDFARNAGAELLMGWFNDHAGNNMDRIFYRAHRDTDNSWSKWHRLAYTNDLPTINNGNAIDNQYVSGLKLEGNVITVAHAALPSIPDLSGYATKNELNQYANKSDLSKYVTQENLNGNYATKNDLNNYATKDSLNNYVTDEELNNSLNGYVTQDNLNSSLNGYVKDSELNSNYVNKSEAAQYATTANLAWLNTAQNNHVNAAATNNGIAIGYGSNSDNGIAFGDNVKTTRSTLGFGVSIGANIDNTTGIAIGSYLNNVPGIAIGYALNVGINDICIGKSINAVNAGTNSVLIGYGGINYGNYSVGVGESVQPRSGGSVTIGSHAHVESNATCGVAVGANSNACGIEAVVVGHNSYAGPYSEALGAYANAGNASNSIAIGYYANSNDTIQGIAIGHNTVASNYSTAIGGAVADKTAPNSVVMGPAAKATVPRSVIIGMNASTANLIINTNDGKADVVAIGYLAIANNNATRSTSVGAYAYCTAGYGTAVGVGAHSGAYCSTALGVHATAVGVHSIAIGLNAQSDNSGGISIGYNARSMYEHGIALGNQAHTMGHYSTAIGYNAYVGNQCNYSTAIGYNAAVSVNNVMVLGDSSLNQIQSHVTTITSTSDERIKEDITEANTEQCLTDVNRLPVKRYKLKKFVRRNPVDEHVTGFIAQDTYKVFPKSVFIFDEHYPVLDENDEPVMVDDTDEEGNVRKDYDGQVLKKEKTFLMKDVYHMDTSFAVPTLWAAVQELSKRVDSLTDRVTELESENTELETRLQELEMKMPDV